MTRITGVTVAFLFVVLGIGLDQAFFQGLLSPPLPDPGHRLYGAVSERGAAAILQVLGQSGVDAKMAFDAGPTHQVVLNDGQRTVIAWFDKEADVLPKDAISLAVSDPVISANFAVATLKEDGFAASVTSIPIPGGSLEIVATDALISSGLVYRPAWYHLTEPPERALPQLK